MNDTDLTPYKKCVDSCMQYAYTFAIMRGFPRHIVVTKDACREQCAREHLSKIVKRTTYAVRRTKES